MRCPATPYDQSTRRWSEAFGGEYEGLANERGSFQNVGKAGTAVLGEHDRGRRYGAASCAAPGKTKRQTAIPRRDDNPARAAMTIPSPQDLFGEKAGGQRAVNPAIFVILSGNANGVGRLSTSSDAAISPGTGPIRNRPGR